MMRCVQLGLRDDLRGSLEPWLCYDCGDCSDTCPRKADPAASMMTLRRFLMAQYDWTGLARKIHRSTIWHIGALLAAGAIVFLLGYFMHEPAAIEWLQTVTGADLFATHPCLPVLKAFDWLVLFLVAFFVFSNAAHMHRITVGRSGLKVPAAFYVTELKRLLYQVGSQAGFLKCKHGERRWRSHLAIASGCVLMFVLVFLFLDWFQTDKLYPLYHPQRWLGYLATAAILFGAGDALVRRIRRWARKLESSEIGDWVLPFLLLLTAVTGILIHILRYAGLDAWAWDLYAAHMVVTVPMLLVEIPFGKWSHMFYQPLAIYFQALKERALEQAAGGAAAAPQPGEKVA